MLAKLAWMEQQNLNIRWTLKLGFGLAFHLMDTTKNHTGAYMSLGIGAAYASSSKQKLKTHSSTKEDLVAAYDSMPQIVWTRYFLEEEGYRTNDTFCINTTRLLCC